MRCALLFYYLLLFIFNFTFIKVILFLQQLAAQLKAQLEQARKLAATNKTVAQKETVILTRTDEKGMLLSF